jgi:hypothetical protein
VHDPPGLKVGNGPLNVVADLVDLRVELFLPVQGLRESPEAYQAWIDGTIKPNLPPGAQIADPEFIDLTLAIEPADGHRALAAIWLLRAGPAGQTDSDQQRCKVCRGDPRRDPGRNRRAQPDRHGPRDPAVRAVRPESVGQ